MSENVTSLFGLRWKLVNHGLWEARAGKYRYDISECPGQFIVARYIAAPTSGKRYCRYIPDTRVRHLTLEEAKAAAAAAAAAR